MKTTLSSAVLLALLLAPPGACAQYGAVQNVLANTDPALAAAFKAAQAAMPVFSVPAPVAITQDKGPDTPAADYLPLNKRAVLEYEYTSSEFPAAKLVRLEYMEYSEHDRTARINMIIFNKVNPKVSNFVQAADNQGVRSSDSPLYGPRLEIPFPLVYNGSWDEGADHSRVAALNARVTVPAGTYAGCLRITTRLNGGEAGAAERYYAPGVGLVYEQLVSEDRQETIKLSSYRLK